LQNGVALTGSHSVSVDPASVGLPAGAPEAALQLTFNDNSSVTLVGQHGQPDSSWFL
jgi:hypothetical protein